MKFSFFSFIYLFSLCSVFAQARDSTINEILEGDIEIQETDEVFQIWSVQEMAKFMGQDPAISLPKFIQKNLAFPFDYQDFDSADLEFVERELANGFRVIVEFTVDTDSNVSQIKVLNSSNDIRFESFEKAAMKVIEQTSGKWTPATQREEPVRVRYRIPINFNLF